MSTKIRRAELRMRPATERDAAFVINTANYDLEPGSDEYYIEEFRRAMQDNRTLTLIAEHRNRAVGYIEMAVREYSFHINAMCVDPRHRREGIASYMLDHFVKKGVRGKARITTDLCELLLAPQQFMRAVGFRCVNIVPRGCPCGLDFFHFVRKLE